MKLNRLFIMCAAALALAISASTLLAQDNNNDNGGQRRQRQGGGPGGGNWDPAQMQQRMMERVQEQLGFTDGAEWDAVKPLVQKVMDARRDVGVGGMGRLMGGRSRGGDQGGDRGRSSFGGLFQTSPEQDALQKAIDDNAPASQIKDLLAKYKKSQEAKQAKLEAAQDALKAVLSTKQEAEAYLLGLVR